MTTYANHLSSEKEIARKIVYNLVRTYKKENVRALTLPSFNFILEEKLTELPNVSVDCIERDELVIQKQLLSPVSRKVRLHKGDINDLLIQKGNDYDVLFLDYCSAITSRIWLTLIHYIQKSDFTNVKYLVITLAGKREQQGKQIAEHFNCTLEQWRESEFAWQLALIGNKAGIDVKLLKLFKYKGGTNKHGQNMYTYSFKITKKK